MVSQGDVLDVIPMLSRPWTSPPSAVSHRPADAAAGIKVALSGVGGNEMFAGYSSFREIPGTVPYLTASSVFHETGAEL
jgi:asparagine synthase (glutamine-hydrolysing)